LTISKKILIIPFIFSFLLLQGKNVGLKKRQARKNVGLEKCWAKKMSGWKKCWAGKMLG
jgi:hypothetical protein